MIRKVAPQAQGGKQNNTGAILALAAIAGIFLVASNSKPPDDDPPDDGGGNVTLGGKIQDISLSQNACLHQQGPEICKEPGQPVTVRVSFIPSASRNGSVISWDYRFKVRVIRDPDLPFGDEFIYTSGVVTFRVPPELPTIQMHVPTPAHRSFLNNLWQLDVILEARDPVNTNNWKALDGEFLSNAFRVSPSCVTTNLSGNITNITVAQDPTAY